MTEKRVSPGGQPGLEKEAMASASDTDSIEKVIPVLLAEPVGDGRLRVWCPYCRPFRRRHRRGAWHFHGTGGSPTILGHRGAHCWTEDSPFLETGYVLRLRERSDG